MVVVVFKKIVAMQDARVLADAAKDMSVAWGVQVLINVPMIQDAVKGVALREKLEVVYNSWIKPCKPQ